MVNYAVQLNHTDVNTIGNMKTLEVISASNGSLKGNQSKGIVHISAFQ